MCYEQLVELKETFYDSTILSASAFCVEYFLKLKNTSDSNQFSDVIVIDLRICISAPGGPREDN